MLLLINEIFGLGLNSPFANFPHWVIYLLLAIFGVFAFLLSRLVIYHRPVIGACLPFVFAIKNGLKR
ncbi:hypothetical protein B5J94_08895 [Moraxella lacunata]|uniref:Uncharacterized protein n=1 Tax=Moraxella lacunata TaxID=477 RepID=A0A1V4GT16_MORLA|nr:hypothetical protein B5J94_08895 [Moraxella lacunata]